MVARGKHKIARHQRKEVMKDRQMCKVIHACDARRIAV
jgi:hypothetical protein